MTSSKVNWPNFYRIRNLITVFSLIRSHHEVGLISKVQTVTPNQLHACSNSQLTDKFQKKYDYLPVSVSGRFLNRYRLQGYCGVWYGCKCFSSCDNN